MNVYQYKNSMFLMISKFKLFPKIFIWQMIIGLTLIFIFALIDVYYPIECRGNIVNGIPTSFPHCPNRGFTYSRVLISIYMVLIIPTLIVAIINKRNRIFWANFALSLTILGFSMGYLYEWIYSLTILIRNQ